jgi:protein-S-isoprenylcysteine O-methyltransferase Ste14
VPDRLLRLASVAAFAGVAVAIALLAYRHGLITPSPIASAVQVLAIALMVWARITFGARSFHAAANPTAGGLVTRGPYRYVRHPIYAAILYLVWAGVLGQARWLGGPLVRPSGTHVALALAATLFTAVRMLTEERLVIAQYPEYREYSARTKRMLPGVL